MPKFVDLFCGAGYGARGAVHGGGTPLLAVDAWELAARTYRANFPDAEVINARVEDALSQSTVQSFKPDVLLTSPECTSHSIARGAKPGSEMSKETAIGIVPWVEAMAPRWLIVENVNRMRRWGRHEELLRTIRQHGYSISDLHLNSAEFGSAQARKRMFLVCDRKGTGVSRGKLLKHARSTHKSASAIIRWDSTYPAKPLYKRGRATATLERASRAIKELGAGVPFLIVYYGSDYAGGWQRLDVPLRTVTTIDRFGLVTWERGVPYLRMLQPEELSLAMEGSGEHLLPYGTRREKVKLCGNGVCADVTEAIFRWISSS